MSWTYRQKFGQLLNPSGEVEWVGYAGGNCGKNPEGMNNPAMQDCKCIGPIPQGTYTAGAPVEHSHLGPFAVPLNPSPSNEMFGRSAFFMHGDTKIPGNASEGCIIMPRQIREKFATSPDTLLLVTE